RETLDSASFVSALYRSAENQFKIVGIQVAVYDIIDRLKKTGNIEHLPYPRHPLILTPNKRQYLSRLLQVNNATTSALMTTNLNNMYSDLNVSTQTVQRILKNKATSCSSP
ncbi:7420_t:CDS:2, partial [Funneliformis geosporum]